MKMTKKVTRGLLICGFMFSLLTMSGCKFLQNLLNSAFQKPTMRYKTMHLKDVSFKGLKMNFEFLLNNPNSVGVTLSKINYMLALNGKEFLKGINTNKTELKANGQSPVYLPFEIEYVKFAKSLLAFFQGKDTLPYQLKTTFGVDTPIGEVPFSFDKKGEAPLPRLPEVSMGQVDVKVMKSTKQIPLIGSVQIPSGAQLNLKLNLKQRGKFPVNLKGLAYNVSMGGVSLLKAQTKAAPLKVGGSQVLNIPITLGRTQAITLIRSVINKKFDVKLNGALDMGLFKLPLNFDASKSKKLNLPEVGGLSSLLKYIKYLR